MNEDKIVNSILFYEFGKCKTEKTSSVNSVQPILTQLFSDMEIRFAFCL